MSDRGGKRQGAGRPKGMPNKKTEAVIQAIQETGMTPLEYLTSIYQSEAVDEKSRIEAAKAAAPYVHAKLSNVEMNSNVTIRSHEEMINELE